MRTNKLILCAVIALLFFAACAGDAEFMNAPVVDTLTWDSEPAPMEESFTLRGGAVNQRYGLSHDFAELALDEVGGFATWNTAVVDSPPAPMAQAPATPGIAPPQPDWEDIAETGVRHVIQNASVEMETGMESEDFDRAVADLRHNILCENGYIESEMLTNHGRRMFSIVLRVPAAQFEDTLAAVHAVADVRSTNSQARDVTDEFYDMAGNLATRRIEEERILALIDEAENIHDLLALETRLSNTRQSIERYNSRLNTMAGQIAFSTIAVTLFDMYEEEEPVPAAFTFGERLGGAFGDSVDGTLNTLQNIVVFFAGAFFPLMILAVFIIVPLIVGNTIRKRRTQ